MNAPSDPKRILVFQTAFIGDVVLTLPLFQVLRARFPGARIDGVTIPRAADLLRHHPAITNVIPYDKRGHERGGRAIVRLIARLRREHFDVAVVPHRSIRSALIIRLSGIPRRIGYDISAGSWCWTDTIRYRKEMHEVDRTLALAEPLLHRVPERELPRLYPTEDDTTHVVSMYSEFQDPMRARIAIAPGTVWKTKRWPKESFLRLVGLLVAEEMDVALVGGKEDEELCAWISEAAASARVKTLAGRLTLRQTAALLKGCRALVSNDSAPMHLAVAVGTPVVAIFGATVPAIGFAPLGPHDVVVEVKDLPCRPCSIHGSNTCPIKTFDCMLRITPERVLSALQNILRLPATSSL